MVRSATVKGQTRDLKPLRRGRDTASADVALKEDEKDEVRRLIPYRRHESPSDALHKVEGVLINQRFLIFKWSNVKVYIYL